MKKVFGAACLLWVLVTAFGFITQFYLKQVLAKLS